jgi:hypothetical protein
MEKTLKFVFLKGEFSGQSGLTIGMRRSGSNPWREHNGRGVFGTSEQGSPSYSFHKQAKSQSLFILRSSETPRI